MKKLLAISLIAAGTFISIGAASALEYRDYPTWAQDAHNSGAINN